MARLLDNPCVEVLGNVAARRLPIFSFLVYPGAGSNRRLPLHGRFVARLLNDLFGVQARGGCACAGPYGHALLGVGEELSLGIRAAIVKGYHGVKPGWTRVSLPYYLSREEFQFILAAIDFVAAHGHRFLPLYAFDWSTGNWAFRRRTFKHHAMTEELLRDHNHGSPAVAINCTSDSDSFPTKKNGAAGETSKFERYLEIATKIALSLPEIYDEQIVNQLPKGLDPDIVHFRV